MSEELSPGRTAFSARGLLWSAIIGKHPIMKLSAIADLQMNLSQYECRSCPKYAFLGLFLHLQTLSVLETSYLSKLLFYASQKVVLFMAWGTSYHSNRCLITFNFMDRRQTWGNKRKGIKIIRIRFTNNIATEAAETKLKMILVLQYWFFNHR